jgi:hypothetical protein
MDKRPGWYYMADGRLRYHDEDGWTEYFLDFEQVRAMDGQPPPPMTMLDQVLARKASVRRERPLPWWRRWSRRR